MTCRRAMNFAPGPAKVPEDVIDQAASEFKSYRNEGLSVMELSHRGAAFKEIIEHAEATLRSLMGIPSNYKVLFLQGGGTGQFAAIPLNLCSSVDSHADYIVTGAWSQKAAEEAEKYCQVNKVLPITDQYTGIPPTDQWKFSSNASYVYYCSNETIHGIEFNFVPEIGDSKIPLICDMSSNILSRLVDVSKFGVIFAGAQKNLGIAGVTVVIIREDLIKKPNKICPAILDYSLNAKHESLYNTPATYSIYILDLVLRWIKHNGGVKEMEKRNKTKSYLTYNTIDNSDGFYCSNVDKDCRSRMNIPFRIGGKDGNEELETEFLDWANKNRMISLKGHRSVGGIRISLFNAVTLKEAVELVQIMKDFRESKQNGDVTGI